LIESISYEDNSISNSVKLSKLLKYLDNFNSNWILKPPIPILKFYSKIYLLKNKYDLEI